MSRQYRNWPVADSLACDLRLKDDAVAGGAK